MGIIMAKKIETFITKWFGMMAQARTAATLAKLGNFEQANRLINK